MSPSCKVIAIASQKGGVAKSTTSVQLSIGLARNHQRVLMIDTDPQGTGSMMLGVPSPDELSESITSILDKIINDEPYQYTESIIKTAEGVDLIPANIDLASLEVRLVNTLNRERILKQHVDQLREGYDYIIIDCPPSLGMLTINALTASDSVIIPTLAEYPSARGLIQLLHTVKRVKRSVNPSLCVKGILLTMFDARTNYNREIAQKIREAYGADLTVFKTTIPKAIKLAEAGCLGKSVFLHSPHSKVAEAYLSLVKEVQYDG